MIVISDTSPIRYLVLIDAINLLPALFQAVIIPPAVAAELQHPRTPLPVRRFIASQPKWLTIETPTTADPTLFVDPGEQEAILLAMERHAPLLIDDDRGRKAATVRRIHTIGTLAVLELAAEQHLVELPTIIGRLRNSTNFRIDESTLDSLLARDAKRTDGGS